MKSYKALLSLFATLALTACSEGIPAGRADMVGTWQNEIMTLRIAADGAVEYERNEGNTKTSIQAWVQRFDADSFEVGVGPFTTTFVINTPPYLDGTVWKMVIDGQELTKVGEQRFAALRTAVRLTPRQQAASA